MKNTLNPIRKRDLLYKKISTKDGDLLRVAKNFEAAGNLSDAADFFQESPEELKRLLKTAAEEGDSFLFLKISRYLGESEFDRSLLASCAAKAKELGKTRYAILAYETLGEDEQVATLKESISEDGDQQDAIDDDVFIAAHAEEIAIDGEIEEEE